MHCDRVRTQKAERRIHIASVGVADVRALGVENHRNIPRDGVDVRDGSLQSTDALVAVRLVKRDAERRLVTGVVLEPDTVDLQKDTVTAEEIGLAMERWMLAGHAWDVQHEGPEREDIKLVECYQCPADVVIGEEPVRKGTWVTTVKVLDDDLWAKVKAGEITGFSIEGLGVRTPVNA